MYDEDNTPQDEIEKKKREVQKSFLDLLTAVFSFLSKNPLVTIAIAITLVLSFSYSNWVHKQRTDVRQITRHNNNNFSFNWGDVCIGFGCNNEIVNVVTPIPSTEEDPPKPNETPEPEKTESPEPTESETAEPESTDAPAPTEDACPRNVAGWDTYYQVKAEETLSHIAAWTDSSVDELVTVNCIENRNNIATGLIILVPHAPVFPSPTPIIFTNDGGGQSPSSNSGGQSTPIPSNGGGQTSVSATDEPVSTPNVASGRDADGDGFPDSSDACPNKGNEGGLGVDDTGCPYYDADWDGVVDRNDLCPNSDNNNVDSNGCP